MSKKLSFVKDRIALDNAKSHLRDYLVSIGHCPDHYDMIRCICSAHSDEHPSMKFYADTNTVHCFACGFDGDIVDVIAEVEGLAPKSKEAIERAIEFAGTASSSSARTEKNIDFDAIERHVVFAHAHFDDVICRDYLSLRGFSDDDLDTLRHFEIGFDPIHKTLVIPHGNKYYTARRIDNCSKDKRFIFNCKAPVQLFNESALFEQRFAVTEGAIDALSLICAGFPAVALGGSSTHSKFIQKLKSLQSKPIVYIAFDNDRPGRQAADNLAVKLSHIGIQSVNIIPHSEHDYNDIFKSRRNELELFLDNLPIPSSTIASSDSDNDNITGNPILDFQQIVASDWNANKQRAIKARQLNKRRAELGISTTDAGIAEQIILHFAKDRIKYNMTSSRFMTYRKPIWIEHKKDAELRQLVRDYRSHLIQSDEAELYQPVSGCLTSEKKIPKVISYMRSFKEINITNADLNNHPLLLPCINGVVDLETGKLYPHEPTQLWTRTANFAFDPNAHSDVFDSFIKSTISNEDTRAALQRYLGYSITGSIAEEKALFVVGKGGNGKGTLFRTILDILGDFGTPFKIDAILARGRTNDANAASPEYAKLEFVRLAVAEEVPPKAKLDAAQFKLLTGGDYLPVRRLYQESTIIKNVTHKLILSGNSLPALSAPDDNGLKRRLLTLEFKNSFDDQTRDPFLKQKLCRQADKSAIFNWLLDGCLQWQQHGLLVSNEMQQTRSDYLASQDALADFIEDYCKLGHSYSVKRKDLIASIRRNGNFDLRNLTDKELSDRLANIDGISYKHTRKGKAFFGIALLDEQELQLALDDDDITDNDSVLSANDDLSGIPVDDKDIPF